MRRGSLLLAIPLLVACNGGSENTGSTSTGSTQSSEELESVSFTLGDTSSGDDTGPQLEKLSCEELAKTLQAALEAAWPKELSHGGLSMAVRRGDCPPWAGVVGNAEPGTPLETDHVMGAGGISKTLMAAAFMSVVEEKSLDVYEPVSKHLPDIKNKEINIRSLLNHRQALADYARDTALVDNAKKDPAKAISSAEILAAIQDKDIETAAKLEQFLLGHSNAIALDKLSTDLGGQSTPERIQAKLLDPMSIKDMYVWGNSAPTKVAPGWKMDGEQATRRDELVHNSFLGAAAGLRATPSALAQWVEGLTTSKTALSPTSLSYMMRRTSFESSAAEQQGYGLKIWGLKPGVDAYGNDGLSPGYAALAMTVPTQQVTVAIMTNNESQKAALLAAFETALLSTLQPWQPDQGMPRLSLKDAAPFIP